MRITFTIHAMTMGGAERFMSIVTSSMAARGHHITLITLAGIESDFFELHPAVERVGLNVLKPSKSLWDSLQTNRRVLVHLRRAIRAANPDVVIAFMPDLNIYTRLATIGTGIPVIISEHTDPRRDPLGRVWKLARRLCYPDAAAVVVQTENVRRWAVGFVHPSKVKVFPYPAPAPISTANVQRKLQIISLGRLTYAKGYDLLLRAFALCASRYSDWQLSIIGEGEARPLLTKLIAELGLASRVQLPGAVRDPIPLLCQASLFMLSSRWEGFPNALLEAMACALPVISFDCDSGPSDIIRHNIDGLLVPPGNIDALSNALEYLMGNESERLRLGTRATEVSTRFSLDSIIDRWEQLCQEVM